MDSGKTQSNTPIDNSATNNCGAVFYTRNHLISVEQLQLLPNRLEQRTGQLSLQQKGALLEFQCRILRGEQEMKSVSILKSA